MSPRIHRKAQDPDLRYKFWALLAQYLSLTLATTGFVAVLISLNANTKSLRENVQNAITGHILNLDKLFIDKPYLAPYFSGGKTANPSDQNYAEIVATAEMIADTMDLISGQMVRFRDQWENTDAWESWLDDSLKKSPVLVQYIRGHRSWYGPSLVQRMDRVVP